MKTQQRSSLTNTLLLRFNVTKIQNTLTKLCLASTAAAIAETVTFPIDLTKTRLQIQGERSGWGGPKRGMFQVAWGVVRDEGLFKLWRGVKPAVIRHIFYSGVRVTLYEFIREHVLKRDADGQFAVYKSIIAGSSAGVFGQMIASPMDLIKIRFQTDGARQLQGYNPRYRGVYHALVTIIREEGVLKLWRGVIPNCQRAALVALGDFATYDTTKRKILLYTKFKDNVSTHLMASVCAGLAATTLGELADSVFICRRLYIE